MSSLLYCIFEGAEQHLTEPLLGVGGQPISVIVRNGLGAGLSRIADSDLAPHVSGIIAYEKVIESFYRDRTVIPMSYGCVFEKEAQVLQLLEERGKQYKALLKDLEGCVEMGIRVLLENVERAERQARRRIHHSPSCIPPTTGAAYLAAQRERYKTADQMSLEESRMLEKIYSPLSGLFARSKEESSSLAGHRLLSLCFLVPRNSLECFRRAFRYIRLNEYARLLLSGPWPPYNFVCSDNLSAAPGELRVVNGSHFSNPFTAY